MFKETHRRPEKASFLFAFCDMIVKSDQIIENMLRLYDVTLILKTTQAAMKALTQNTVKLANVSFKS